VAFRTNPGSVIAVLEPGGNYRTGADLTPFIRGANLVVTRVVACAAARGLPLDAATAKEVESWYAAYLYTRSDPTWKSKSTLSASGSNNGDPEDFLNGARDLDPSGCLATIVQSRKNQLAGGGHLGTKPSEKTSYPDYDPGGSGL
jgi:hypothetical protein